MTKKAFIPEGIKVVGPYSPAVECGDFIYISGQIPLDASTGKIVEGGIKEQTKQCLANLSKVLKAANITQENIVKTTVFLTDMNDFVPMNEVYGEFFTAPYPARSAIGINALPLGVKVEIEVIAKK